MGLNSVFLKFDLYFTNKLKFLAYFLLFSRFQSVSEIQTDFFNVFAALT